MQLYLKQKVFSLKGKFSVYDANETMLYTVEGKLISITSSHYIYDPAGEQLAFIHQKVPAMMPKFYIDLPNGTSYMLKSKLSIAHEVAVVEELGWEIRGDFMQHNYSITKDGQELGSVHQKWISWGDTYEITIADGVDPVVMLSVILCFDIMHANEAAASAVTTD